MFGLIFRQNQRLTFFCILCYIPLLLFAQSKSQRGVVCTSVNPSNPTRKAVPGVRVVINGTMGTATNSKGEFNQQVPATFQVNGVDAKDYILIAPKEEKMRDKDVLEVVVVSKEQKDVVSNDRFKALQKKYRRQGEEYLQTRNRLQEALDSLDEKDARYQDLKAQYEEMRSLYINHIEDEDKISENLRKIAEELALTDFQTLDTLQQRICELRWNGDWEEIESYIRSTMKGSAEEEIERIRQTKAAASEQVDEATAKLKAGMLAQKAAEQEEKDWFFKMESLIDKFKVSHENDSVSKYYKILTDADSTNYFRLYEAGVFEYANMADYDLALNYHERAVALLEETDTFNLVSNLSIANIYLKKAQYEKAKVMFEKVMQSAVSLFGENSPNSLVELNPVGII